MKKLFAITLALIIAFSFVTAQAALPDYLTEQIYNYTADYTFSVTFESSDELVALLKELEMPEEIENFVDIKALISSILSSGAKMKIQADMSNDMRKAEISLTADTGGKVSINKNLEISADVKMGMWIKMDLDAEDPVFEIIYSHPLFNKYLVIDVFDMAQSEEEAAEIKAYFGAIFNEEFINSVNDISTELMNKYAKVNILQRRGTVKIDNEGFLAMLRELMPVMFEKINEAMPPEMAEDADMETVADSFYIPEDIQILGKEGITYNYSLTSGKITKVDMNADISIDLSKLVEAFGAEWIYETKGVLEFDVKSTVNLTKVGMTKVNFPELNKENSFTMEEMMPQSESEYIQEGQEYPYFYVSAFTSELPVIDGEIYVPLRIIMENAFDTEVYLEYQDGIITLQSQYFPGFTTLKLCENSTQAYVDSALCEVSKVITKDGRTYVGQSLFEEVFGWTIDSANYDMLYDEYYISFLTQTW